MGNVQADSGGHAPWLALDLAQSSSKFPSNQAEQGRQCQVYLLYNLCYNQNYCQRNMTRSHSVSCKFCSLESNSYSTLLICDQRSVCLSVGDSNAKRGWIVSSSRKTLKWRPCMLIYLLSSWFAKGSKLILNFRVSLRLQAGEGKGTNHTAHQSPA